MNNEDPGSSFDPLAKTNLFDFILSDELYQLKNIKTETSKITLEEYENEYHITIPESLIDVWQKNTLVHFNCISGDLKNLWSMDNELLIENYPRNKHINVNVFSFSLEDTHSDYGLYQVIKSLGSKSVNQLIENEEEYLQNCFRVCAQLAEEYNNSIYQEIFYFDSFGNIDSVRFLNSINSRKQELTKFINQLLESKNKYQEHLQLLKHKKNKQTTQKLQITPKKSANPMIEPYLHKIPECLQGIHKHIEHAEHEWKIHQGDLVIDGNWQPDNINLLITGNLQIKGVYDGYSKGYSFVVVLGDMTAEHMVCWYGLSVVGNLTVNGIINLEHYLFPFEIAGNLRARHLSIQHSQKYVHWNNLNLDTPCENNSTHSPLEILKNIAPALLAKSIAEDDLHSISIDFIATTKNLLKGISPFREAPLDDEIIKKMFSYADNYPVSQEEMIADMKSDPLLALIIANYQNLQSEGLSYLKNHIGFYGEDFDEIITWTIENKISDK